MTLRRIGQSAVVAALIGQMCLGYAQTSAQQASTIGTSAQQLAPIDLTGQWVSIVNEDWRWRMLTPPRGDTAGIPLNAQGRAVADSWDPSQDGSCKAYGTAGLMRMPIRVRISWESGDVLKIESDAGEQVRRLHFKTPPSSGARTLPGRSIARWERPAPPGDGWGFGAYGPPSSGGSLKVVTSELKAGWLRRNGVAYSENAEVTEYYDRFDGPEGNEWFVVTTVVDDPTYLTQPYITSSHFRREALNSNWHPQSCTG